jgi:hypothetical protein
LCRAASSFRHLMDYSWHDNGSPYCWPFSSAVIEVPSHLSAQIVHRFHVIPVDKLYLLEYERSHKPRDCFLTLSTPAMLPVLCSSPMKWLPSTSPPSVSWDDIARPCEPGVRVVWSFNIFVAMLTRLQL